jgi:hypothetical protein
MYSSKYRRIRWIWVILIILGLLHRAAPDTPPSVYAEGSEPGLVHCTDWAVAKMRDTGTDQDQPIALFKAGVIWHDFTGTTANQRLPMIPPEAPPDPGWRVLKRPREPFAVFYTETSTSPHALLDAPAAGSSTPTTAAGNSDLDQDDNALTQLQIAGGRGAGLPSPGRRGAGLPSPGRRRRAGGEGVRPNLTAGTPLA